MLASIGDHVPMNIDVILEGFLSDYGFVVESKFELMDSDEAEGFLLAHEFCLGKYKKKTLTDVASLNLTHAFSMPNSICT